MPSTSFLDSDHYYYSVHNTDTDDVADMLHKQIRELYGELSEVQFDMLSPDIIRTKIKHHKDVRCALAIAGLRVKHETVSLMSLIN